MSSVDIAIKLIYSNVTLMINRGCNQQQSLSGVHTDNDAK